MDSDSCQMVSPRMSLRDLLGEDHIKRLIEASSFLEGPGIRSSLNEIAEEKVDFFPTSFQKRCDELLDYVGSAACAAAETSIIGAPTESIGREANAGLSPLAGFGFVRVGEDGKVHLSSKSEHYHASLGHRFPGFRLIENARKLGITNTAHNSGRGYVQRKLELELVRLANGVGEDDPQTLQSILESREKHVLNRVINLETGSIACEAALKMMLARFYRADSGSPDPAYVGKTPVILVLGDDDGGKQANYHGTNILNQIQRGMWPELAERLEGAQAFIVKSVPIDDLSSFRKMVAEWDSGSTKIAGFFHEIILMNYGAVKLDGEYLHEVYRICDQHDIPVCCDEIQTGVWYPDLFLFRDYGLRPDLVTIGKGIPGGEYASSRVITTAGMDNLGQFGALVTNGQQELAAIAYLMTMEFARRNREVTRSIGEHFESELKDIVAKHPALVHSVNGMRHLTSIQFHEVAKAVAFAKHLNDRCIDTSVQSYKAASKPSALMKLPIIASYKMVDFLAKEIEEALSVLETD